VIDMGCIEPLDTAAVLAAAAATRGVVTAEEATTTGGLGAAVASLLAQHSPTPMRILGVPRRFAPTGSASFLLEHFGLTADGIAAAARDLAGR
jgi:transketolase